jgi:hypothetical protein
VGVIGGVRKRFDACVGGGALAIRGLVRFDGRLRTHGGGAGARIAHFTVGEGDRTVREADEALVGDGDPANRGGEGGEGGVSVVIGRTMDVPGDGPDLWVDVRQQSGLAHIFVKESAVER